MVVGLMFGMLLYCGGFSLLYLLVGVLLLLLFVLVVVYWMKEIL